MSNFNADDIPPSLKAKDTWLRILFIILFGCTFYVSVFIIALLALLQLIAKLFTGQVTQDLARFGHNLGTYLSQIASYVTFASDFKPFPFSNFPNEHKNLPANWDGGNIPHNNSDAA
ncbi:MAG: DUF4389 domain-containing protein [Alphaproteobacteria bacterium]|nr:DUF4389 domain-containing protein [Alphaproteobacteria bacterium]NDC55633.1 DUF4389 domain-containing protein [Alphaproteobacteria bacterium]NDG04216.1 DUF4389 domain-containing protein [Alphaproteobacteria bacterium]